MNGKITNLVSSGQAAHFHYEAWSGTKIPDAEGWTYHKCQGCPHRWRTKTITESLDGKKQGTDLRLVGLDADVAAGIGRNPAAPSKVVGENR